MEDSSQQEASLTLYFDGSCPLCLAEMDLLKHKDQRGVLKFEDITDKNFSEERHGLTCELAMKSIKGKTNTGVLLDGVAVFAKAYELVGMRRYARLLGAPRLQGLLSWAYLKFAKHRHLLSKALGPLALKLVHFYIKKSSLKSTHQL